jgi:hypothetical protein
MPLGSAKRKNGVANTGRFLSTETQPQKPTETQGPCPDLKGVSASKPLPYIGFQVYRIAGFPAFRYTRFQHQPEYS